VKNSILTPKISGKNLFIKKLIKYKFLFIFSIYIGTWNVNGQPTLSSLNDWLTSDSEPPDIYAIGFQELDLSKEAFLFNDSPREEEWL
jgi:phosphatidylinositol-bisphosphatase